MLDLLTPLLENGIGQLLLYLSSIGGVSVAIPLLLEALKGRVPFINRNHQVILRMVTALATLSTSIGLGYSFDLGTGELVIRGLTARNLTLFVVAIVGQAGLQEHVYQAFVKKGRLPFSPKAPTRVGPPL